MRTLFSLNLLFLFFIISPMLLVAQEKAANITVEDKIATIDSVSSSQTEMDRLMMLSEKEFCKAIQNHYNEHETKLNKKVKAPQNFTAFDKVKNTVKLVNYESEGRELKTLLDTTNIEKGEKKKAVVYLHGGFSLSYESINNCRKFTEKDYIVLAPSYRGENGNAGNYELFFGEVTDAKNAIKWLAKQDFVHPDSIYVFGHSIGGGLSLALSLHEDVPVALGGSCVGIYDIGSFEYWQEKDENRVPFDIHDELEVELRLPIYSLECMERQHFMYIGTDDGFQEYKDWVLNDLFYVEEDILLKFKEVEGDHFSGLEPSIEAFIQQIEAPKETNSDKGVENCLSPQTQQILAQASLLFSEKMESNFDERTENPYQVFIQKYNTKNLPDSFFNLSAEALERFNVEGFWTKDEENKLEVEVIPPGGITEEMRSFKPELYRPTHKSKILHCFAEVTQHPSIKIHAKLYDFAGANNSSGAAYSLEEELNAKDYESLPIQQFIVLEVFLQKLMHENLD